MAELGGASPEPALTPVESRGRGPSARAALGLVVVVLVALVGISLVGQFDGRPGPQMALDGPTTTPATAATGASRTAAPAAASSPSAPREPSRGTPPPSVTVSVGPVATCPPESTPDEPGPVEQARPPAGSTAFDRDSGRIVLVAGTDAGVETWTFDVCTNTWTRMHPDQEPPGAGGLVYDVDSDATLALSGASRVWAYDLEADSWTEKGLPPGGSPGLELRFYDPVSGLVVATGDDGDPNAPDLELWSYDVETDTWTPIRQANRLPVDPWDYVYDASVDRLVAYDPGGRSGGARTWLFDLRTGTWSGTAAVTPQFAFGWIGPPPPAIAYDEAAERTVMAGQGCRVVAYDAAADRWETLFAPALEAATECRDGQQIIYDPVNERLVAHGGTVYTTCMPEAPDDMWAFDLATRSWTLVVRPTPVPASSRDLAAGGAPASADADRSPWIRAAKVTLHGGPFFTRVPGVADEPWTSSPPAAPATVIDGLFLPECQLWTEGTVWWEETTSDPLSRAWIEIDLGGTWVLDAATVQADANEEYLLLYRDPKTAAWVPLWVIPPGAGGMATRPDQGDASVRWPIARPVVTDALRFEALVGDAQYSVSEIAVFGVPAP